VFASANSPAKTEQGTEAAMISSNPRSGCLARAISRAIQRLPLAGKLTEPPSAAIAAQTSPPRAISLMAGSGHRQ